MMIDWLLVLDFLLHIHVVIICFGFGRIYTSSVAFWIGVCFPRVFCFLFLYYMHC